MRDNCPRCGSSTGYGDIKCFKCGTYNQCPVHRIQQPAALNKHGLTVPTDLVLSPQAFSIKALEWLYSAGIYESTIRDQYIGYIPSSDRVWIPAYDSEGVLRFYQTRALDGGIKYLTHGKSSEYLVQYTDHISKTCVIVEDHISAIRVRKLYNVVCISGTTLSSEHCKKLISDFDTFIMWLDPDVPGQQATRKNVYRLKANAEVATIKQLFTTKATHKYQFLKVDAKVVGKDPKRYLDSEIATILTTKVIECI